MGAGSSGLSTRPSLPKPSMMTLPFPARPPACAWSQAFWRSAAVFTVDWPLPELDITGLTTHGSAKSASAATASLASAAPSCGSRRQRGVGTPFDSKMRFDITYMKQAADGKL